MLTIQSLSKKYEEFELKNISLEITQGDYFVLLGPSGSGKTILFETIAGIVKPDSGKIYFEGKEITRQPVSDRHIGLVFQDGAVFPHMTVGQNISYPLRMKKMSKPLIREKVISLAGQMGIAHLLHRKTMTLSGGELRRVAIARTLALDPKCLLLDEPLSSLDVQWQLEILDILKKLNKQGWTIMHITHNYHEAFYLANKMAVLEKGMLITHGTPSEIISQPKSEYIRAFLNMSSYLPSTYR